MVNKKQSPRRKSPRRKSPRRKSPRRKSPRRKSPRRKSPRRKSPKRKSRRRKSRRKSPSSRRKRSRISFPRTRQFYNYYLRRKRPEQELIRYGSVEEDDRDGLDTSDCELLKMGKVPFFDCPSGEIGQDTYKDEQNGCCIRGMHIDEYELIEDAPVASLHYQDPLEICLAIGADLMLQTGKLFFQKTDLFEPDFWTQIEKGELDWEPYVRIFLRELYEYNNETIADISAQCQTYLSTYKQLRHIPEDINVDEEVLGKYRSLLREYTDYYAIHKFPKIVVVKSIEGDRSVGCVRWDKYENGSIEMRHIISCPYYNKYLSTRARDIMGIANSMLYFMYRKVADGKATHITVRPTLGNKSWINRLHEFSESHNNALEIFDGRKK